MDDSPSPLIDRASFFCVSDVVGALESSPVERLN